MIYHCVSRVVDRRFAFGKDEEKKLRTYLRMYENFSGCLLVTRIHERFMAHQGYEADARHWAGKVSKEYRMILLEGGGEKLKEVVNEGGELAVNEFPDFLLRGDRNILNKQPLQVSQRCAPSGAPVNQPITMPLLTHKP
ncbi:MAG: hypothetical protein NTW21_36045 [Verrucomicrobia bacterium]|nr:hypothetical protein [Verrucomicrobiota bacterium]